MPIPNHQGELPEIENPKKASLVMIPQKRYERIRKLSDFLDTRFEGPFGFRFGFDALFGLVPFIGDLITSMLSFYIIFQAALLGCSPSTLIRMFLNVLIENLLEMLPLIGNVFDFYWKANLRNLALINQHISNPGSVVLASRLTLFALFVILIGLIILCGVLFWKIGLTILNKLAPYIGVGHPG